MLMPAADMACAMAFDPEKILATELHIALDENVLPIEHPDDEAQIAEFEGTLDLVMIHSLTEAEIDDWKSYYQVTDAAMFRSKFYPLLLMCLNPSLESVKFVLEFVRYGASRSVEYTRKDLPWLKELAQSERTRQRKLHGLNRSRKLKTSPGRHCTWCPLLLNAIWLQEAEKHNSKVLKDLMVKRGPIHYRDGNLAELVPMEKKFYPYRDAVSILDEWFSAHSDEHGLRDKLTVSGLSSPLKAEKRAELAQKLEASRTFTLKTELRIGPERSNGGKKHA
jgi:hypothetical protein